MPSWPAGATPQLAALRQRNCKQNEETIAKALTGNYRREHLFALQQALALYDFYTEQVQDCDVEIAHQFANLKPIADELPEAAPGEGRLAQQEWPELR